MKNWQKSLKQVITDPKALIKLLKLDLALLPEAEAAAKLFPLRVPREFIKRIKKGDLNDPLLRQILPLGVELEAVKGFVPDPLGEKSVNPVPGLLHKYHGRVLLTVAGACGVNCRYCFRREFPYQANNPGTKGWEQTLDYIKNDPTINEVIFSGGDPLVATDHYLATLTKKIAKIPQVKTLRIHTRMPIVIPERINAEFIKWISGTRLHPVIVVHCNHANEINDDVRKAMKRLNKANILVLNQAVLLKDVNDSVEILIELSEKLFEMQVLPYYLHMLDKVSGSAHFEIEERVAKQLIWQMQLRLPGYLVPTLVREEAGAKTKLRVV